MPGTLEMPSTSGTPDADHRDTAAHAITTNPPAQTIATNPAAPVGTPAPHDRGNSPSSSAIPPTNTPTSRNRNLEHDAGSTTINPPTPTPPTGASSLAAMHEIVHIFCTSEDINNLAYALTVKGAIENVWLPAAQELTEQLADLARATAKLPMLSHTHGQTATPTTLGKEMAVFAHRLRRQLKRIRSAEYLGKLNGATGTFGAHHVAVPSVDWPAVSRDFVEGLDLTWNPLTTQIESHDWQADLYADVAHFNRIAHNLATDFWTYISLDYFHQNLAAQGTTGSSTMPHKVNPIRFENAEANLEISSALLDTLAATLVTSRMQRDLTDSTTQRNIGTALGHSLLAVDNLRRGIAGVDPNPQRLAADLDAAWEVLGEPIQQAMRAASIAGATGMGNPYERLKELTRGRTVGAQEMRDFIRSLGIPDDVERRLLELTPASYTGLAARLVGYLD
ncbi:adenylosuccinate lyase [Actinobaculum sp. 352]|nr:adenylosuccinate lyase [Actinobaculum sp. 313]RTE49923.1 adenylosuccinate lyase [Actinobaculum sp. 352]